MTYKEALVHRRTVIHDMWAIPPPRSARPSRKSPLASAARDAKMAKRLRLQPGCSTRPKSLQAALLGNDL
ncbi:hypothetical protein J7E89_25855 [Streptomyces sp. ISL-100]|nr:hypothetical protein [Streptomyces sp. ISL-100]